MPETVTLKIVGGNTVNFILTFTDDAGTAIDITGWTVWMTVKENINDADASAKIQKKVTSHTTPLSGITTITMSATETAGLLTSTTVGRYIHDIQIKNASSEIYTIEIGPFLVETRVTLSTS